MSDTDIDAIRDDLAANFEDLAKALLGEAQSRKSSVWRYGKRGSLALVVRGQRRGLWHDHERGEGGDALALIRRERGGGFEETLAYAKRFLGIADDETDKPDTKAQEARRRKRDQERAAAVKADADDKAARVSRARRYASEAVPIAGTPAEAYLAHRAIPRPACGWPAVVRYHPGRNALLVVSTNALGDVQGVQLVHLTAEGTKRPAEPGRLPKQSLGDMAGAVVRLPGTGGPLLLAEGPETGLTVWAATGRETWIALGSISKVAPPPLRQLAICADDDPRDAPATKALRRAIDTWRSEARNVLLALPWERRRHDKTDFNDLAQQEGIAAVRARIEAALAPHTPPGHRLPVPLARMQTQRAVSRFFAEAQQHDPAAPDSRPVHGIRVDVGIGKSAAARAAIAAFVADLRQRGDQRAVVITVPTHKLGDEQARAFEELPAAKAAGLRAAVWRGRKAPDPAAPGEMMCRDLEAVEDAQKIGANVEEAVCRKGEAKCPFFDACGYQRQRGIRADVWVGAHELTFATMPRAFGKIAALVVDEAAWTKGLEGTEGKPIEITLEAFATDVIIPGAGGDDTDRLRFIHTMTREALAALPDGPIRRADLIAAGIIPDTTKDGHALSWRCVADAGLRPGMSREERRAAVRAAAGNRLAMRRAAAFKAMGALLANDGPEASGWLSLATADTEHGPARVLRLRGRRDLRDGWHAPTLIMDANLDPALLAPYWPALQVTARIEATTPNMRVRQLIGRDWPKSALVPDDRQSPSENDRRRRNSERLRAAVIREARAVAPAKALVVAQKAVEEHWRQIGPLPANMEMAHHNAVAGRNDWQDVRLLVVVGRTLPRANAVERMAEALTGRACSATTAGRYERRDRPIEMEDGTTATTEADWHPDPIAEAIRWQICEGEIVQIIGRGRGVNRTAEMPLDVLVLTDRPLPLPVTETVTMEALEASPADMMVSLAGVALADTADAARAFPALWGNPEAARKAFQRARCGTNPIRDISNGRCPAPLRRVTYQRAGAGRRPTSALVALDLVPDPQGWLEARLGPLAAFALDDPPEPPRPAPEGPPPGRAAPGPEPAQDAVDDPQGIEPARWFAKAPRHRGRVPPIDALFTIRTPIGPTEIELAGFFAPPGADWRAWCPLPHRPPGMAPQRWPT